MRFGGACTRIRTQHMLYKIYVLFQSCRCPNLEQSVEDSVSYKSFLSEDSERSFSGMRKIPVEADFLFFYSTVPGKAMEFSVENMHAFVIIENYPYYSFINTIDLLCPSIWTRFVLHCWFYMHLIGKQSEVTIYMYEGNAYWFTSIIKCPSFFRFLFMAESPGRIMVYPSLVYRFGELWFQNGTSAHAHSSQSHGDVWIRVVFGWTFYGWGQTDALYCVHAYQICVLPAKETGYPGLKCGWRIKYILMVVTKWMLRKAKIEKHKQLIKNHHQVS